MSAMICGLIRNTHGRVNVNALRIKIRLNGETSDKYSTFYRWTNSPPRGDQQKANARPWEQVQLKMPDKCPGGGGMGSHGIDWDITKSLIPVLTLILTLINPNPASKNRKLYQPLNRDSYTARNLTGLLQAVDFTGLRQVVNKSRQVCWFRQAVIGLREQVCRKLFTTEP